jgi:hypothetical protein
MTPQTPPDTSTHPADTRVGYQPDGLAGWEEDPGELPRRPRRKLLSPVPVTLLAVLLTAAGFFAGVQAEKSNSASSGGSGLPAGLAALTARTTTSSASNTTTAGRRASAFAGAAGRGTGFPAAGFAGAASLAGGFTSGEVSYASAHTLYLSTREGATVKVTVPAGTTVDKTVSTSVHAIHPGDTVTVTGSQTKNGGLTASQINLTPSNGTTTTTTTSGSTSAAKTSAGTTPQLFGAG